MITAEEKPATLKRQLQTHKLDKDCTIKNAEILDDYHCWLQLNDISYSEEQQTRYLCMSLLQRADGKKWFLWTKTGKLASSNFTPKIKEFFNKYEAC